MIITHVIAKQLLEQGLPTITPEERQAVRGVCSLETGYSMWWGSDPARGAGSNNMGSVTDPHYVNHEPKGMPPTPPNARQFLHEDSRPDPKNPNVIIHYVTAFKKYDTPVEGLIDVALVMLKANVREAIKTRVVRNISAAMHKNVYYTGVENTADKNINVHARKLFKHIQEACRATGEANPFTLGVADTDEPAVKPPVPKPPAVVPLSFGTTYDLPLLVLGVKGNAVSLWQRLMKLPVTGIYDETTMKATWRLQEAWNDKNPNQRITVDGKVGPTTWSKVP